MALRSCSPSDVERPSSRRPIVTAACCAATLSLLAGCHSQTFRTVDLTPPERIATGIPESELLDVGIAVFDPNVPDSYDAAQQSTVNPAVREAESYYMAYLLKTVVESSGNWGAVRVVPASTYSVDLMVTGTIILSQGERLTLTVEARDARGITWLDESYDALASKYAYGETLPARADPFQHVYTRIADDLAEVYVQLTSPERHNIRHTARMRFASDMLPVAYGDHVQNAEGSVQLVRLPAADDPMMDAIGQIRRREFLFIDNLDAHYAEYERQVRPLYHAWRESAYTASMARLELREKRRRQIVVGTVSLLGGIAGGPATFPGISTGAEMLRDSFMQRNEIELQAEALREVSSAMESEVLPYTLELENQTVHLTGSAEEQFAELRRILRESYLESLDLAAP